MTPLVGHLLAHWQLKALSLAFAVGLWIFVTQEDKGESVYSVPLTLTEVPPGLEVTGLGAETVEVRVRGRRTVLERISERDLRAEVGLGDVRPGELTVRIRAQDVSAPRGAQVVRVTPSRVRVSVDAVARVRVEVAPRLVGALAPGYEVTRVRVEPAQVEVRMPRSDGRPVRAVETAPVDVGGAQETFRREVGLAIPAGVELTEGPRRVAVTVEVTLKR